MKFKMNIILSIVIFLITINIGLAQEEIWFAKGEKALAKKNYNEAIGAFTHVISANPKNIDAHYNRGLAYLFIEETESAAIDFSSVIALDSNNADAYNNRGLCKGYVGDIEGSIADFKKAIEIDSKFSKAFLNLGSAYLAKEDYKEAMNYMDTVIRMDKKNPENYFLRGSVYSLQKKYKEAIDDFTKAIKYGLTISKSFYNRADAYYKFGKYKEAIADFTKVIEKNPKDNEALNNRAMSYYNLGMYPEAIADYTKVIELKPRDYIVLNNRAFAYSKAGIMDSASRDQEAAYNIQFGLDSLKKIDDIKYKKYSFLNGKISIELPDDWHSVSDTAGFGEMMVIAKDSVSKINNYYSTGVRLALDSNMLIQYELKSTQDILDFWEYNSGKNREQYKYFQEVKRKDFAVGEFKGTMKEYNIELNINSDAIVIYELVLAKDDKLFYAYMQASEGQFPYFRKIFDKAASSLTINF